MNRKKRKKKQSTARPAPSHLQLAAEDRTAVAATVAWMLSLMATIVAEISGMLCRWYTVFVEHVELVRVLSFVLLFVALIAGVMTLVMTPIVLRVSKERPPSTIVQIAIVAGSLPLLALGLQMLQR